MSVDIHRHERILSYLVTASARSPSVIAQREGLGARVRTGCLVRSLESAMNTRATNSEWRMRLVDLVQLYAKYGRLYGKVDQKHLESIVRQADQRLATAFIERLSHQDSLMGEALRRHVVSRVSLPFSLVRDVIQDGLIVIMAMRLRDQNLCHAAHLGVRGTEVVRLSDRGETVDLADQDNFGSFVFVPQ